MNEYIKLVHPHDVITNSILHCPNEIDNPSAKGFCFHGMSTAKVDEFKPCDDCPLNFGPWGVWRAEAGYMSRALVTLHELGIREELVYIFMAMVAEERFTALGWSP